MNMSTENRIPRIIHYCWVGGAPKPESVLSCIESWKKCCPDYEIREWNETNYDFTKNKYMNEAYEAKKWGFVPDYARLDIIYQHGGIYLDTDVEAIRSFDALLDNDAFLGFENTGDGKYQIACGLGFGAARGNEVILALRDSYDGRSFRNEDGSLNLTAAPVYTTQDLLRFGLVPENTDQKLPGVTVYASDVLCPKEFASGKLSCTERTVSIHRYDSSWWSEEKKYARQIALKLGAFLPGKLSRRIGKAIALVRFSGLRGLTDAVIIYRRKKRENG